MYDYEREQVIVRKVVLGTLRLIAIHQNLWKRACIHQRILTMALQVNEF